MTRYQLTDGNVIVADAEFISEHHPDAVLQPEIPVIPEADSRLSRLAFRNRFTTAEKVALEIASLDDPAATEEHRQEAAALRVYLKDVDSALYVDLADPATIAGVHSLEAAGLLAAGRAEEILTAPIREEERP
ncbi:MAG: hypothetical protein WBC18_07815 [Ottowia sp.]|uniref:hypothetical protein n=1 Tax=Ottowia sp. TaxID=1898956 RepID=UPI003C791FDB